MRKFRTSAFVLVWALSCSATNPQPQMDIQVSETRPKDVAGDITQDLGTDTAGDMKPDVINDLGKTDTSTCPEGAACDDGNPCTYGETCKAGQCQGGKAYTCDDKRACTDDTCDGAGGCIYTIKKDACLVNGVCYSKGDADPLNDCQACDAKADNKAFTPLKDDTKCLSATAPDVCTLVVSGKCEKGQCVPGETMPRGCDDSSPCTKDTCDPDKGCVFTPVADGTVCTLDAPCKPGSCLNGKCFVPENADCDDHNSCTKDECDKTAGCVHTPLTGQNCDDDDACTVGDKCDTGQCKGMDRNCDDGNICTTDGCDALVGCWHDTVTNPCCKGGVSICDDNNPCTDDTCNHETLKCVYINNTAACDDGNKCTINDTCKDNVCAGTASACNDGNQCTTDSCDPNTGKCDYTPMANGAHCNDGLDCSTNDHCQDSKCVADISGCMCTPKFSKVVNKTTVLAIAQTGNPGDGLDVDENPATCAPVGHCSGGIDNSLGAIGGLPIVKDSITKELASGHIMLLFDHMGFNTQGKAYMLSIYQGKLDPGNSDCDFQTQTCNYWVDPQSYDHDTCAAMVSFDNAKVIGNKLTAGGKNYTFPFKIPLTPTVNLDFSLYYARIEATVTVSNGKITHIKGIIGGAVPKQKILDGIDAIPDGTPLPQGLTKASLKSLVTLLVKSDIDGDGDGVPESASIGLQFEGIAGNITGVQKK